MEQGHLDMEVPLGCTNRSIEPRVKEVMVMPNAGRIMLGVLN